MSNAKLFVISAPSGCGKGTILGEAFKSGNVFYSVSCTTRQPRPGEVNGREYNFITNEEFEKMISEDSFLEYAGYADHYYGTPKAPVLEKLEKGIDVILEIETKGAFQVKKAMPEAVALFILPPSVRELNRRLHKRATEEEDVIAKRCGQAAGEIEKSFEYDYVIMNDGLEEAVEDFLTVYNSAKSGDGKADKFKTENENIKNLIREVLNNA